MSDYFPAKLALGTQFCNRKKEKEFLTKNVDKCRHTVLNAPRRYGKSSLVMNLVTDLKVPFASVDLFLAHDDNAVTKRILDGIGQAVSHILPLNQKILVKLQGLFSKFKVSLSAHGFSLDFTLAAGTLDPVDQVFSGLQGLSRLAKEENKKFIFFLDEFQDIQTAPSSKSIQGAIRHVAQETANIVFIFSGSNRRLLLEMFDDKSMPLYMLCDMLPLDRMSSDDYRSHLHKMAKKKWGEDLPPMVFDKIIALTELHPYYVNLLCNELWNLDNLPTYDDVFAAWQVCYETHEDRLIADLEKLTIKQQDVLKALAMHPAVEPTGQKFLSHSKMAASSVTQNIKSLLDKDMLYKVKKLDPILPQIYLHQIRVLDPLLAYALRKYS